MSVWSIPHSSPQFDSESFTQILPFNQDNPLESGVQSDHAEIALRVSNDRIINVWNISNPAYHCYFKYGDNPPFHNSHLFVDKPFIDKVMDKRLVEKTNNQITTIAERFVNGEVNIQIIVEGYESFYKDLADRIITLGQKEFQIISLLAQKPEKWDPNWNVTGILIDTSRFSIIESGIVCKNYLEEQDSNKQKDFYLPFAYVSDKTIPHSMIIAGVHINGCGSQYPKTGLETLAKTIKELHKKTLGKSDVIAAGDYNTPPKNARTSVLELFESGGILLNASYPTQVNPRSEVGNYDQITILRGETVAKYEILPDSHLSSASQQLISSIKKSRRRLLTPL